MYTFSYICISTFVSLFHSSDPLETPAKRPRLASTSSAKAEEQAIFSLLTASFPVTLHGSLPPTQQRAHLTGQHDRICYDKWRADQMNMRAKHVLYK